MAKQKQVVPRALHQLAKSPKNPRTISERAQGGLACSMERFGDISGIVFNTKLNELVAGHQRVERLRETWGDLVIDTLDDDHGRIVSPGGEVWPVRFVAWSRAKHDAAMIAANSPTISGEYTDDLETLLGEVKTEAADLYDQLLFGDLAVEADADNQVLPEAELQERRTCTVSWPVQDDYIVREFLGLDESAGLPEELGHAIYERIRAIRDAAERQPKSRRKKSA